MAENLIDLNLKKQRQRHYENIFIVSPALTDAVVKQIVERSSKILADTKALSLRQDDWGKKRMAYTISKHAIGHYFYFRFIGTQETVAALERSQKLDANVLRHMTVRLSDEPLSQEVIDTLVERAPKEPSSAPTARGDDDDFGYDASYN